MWKIVMGNKEFKQFIREMYLKWVNIRYKKIKFFNFFTRYQLISSLS